MAALQTWTASDATSISANAAVIITLQTRATPDGATITALQAAHLTTFTLNTYLQVVSGQIGMSVVEPPHRHQWDQRQREDDRRSEGVEPGRLRYGSRAMQTRL